MKNFLKYMLVCATALPLLPSALEVQAHTSHTNPPTTLVVPDQVPNPEVNPTEGMLQNVDAQLNTWYVKKYMVIDSTCLTRVADVNVGPEIYKDRLRRLPTRIEMPFNDVVQEYIDAYTGRLRRSVSFMLGAQNFYIPIFEEALEAEGLPLELKYLPVIESALEPTATSRVGAAGLWQFMIPQPVSLDSPSTALSMNAATPSNLVGQLRAISKNSTIATTIGHSPSRLTTVALPTLPKP